MNKLILSFGLALLGLMAAAFTILILFDDNGVAVEGMSIQSETDTSAPLTSPVAQGKNTSNNKMSPSARHPDDVKDKTPTEKPAETLSKLVQRHAAGDLEPEEKRKLYSQLRQLNSSKDGRAQMVNQFFSDEDAFTSKALYNLILDADLKDTSLIVDLIAQESREHADEYKVRILDLIADTNTIVGREFSPEISSFLSELALHTNSSLRDGAIPQLAWYVASHNQNITNVTEEYLIDYSKKVRGEMYELISSTAITADIGVRESISQSLQSLLYADYLSLELEEKARIRRLIKLLSQ